MRMPLSIPAGIFTSSVLLRLMRPAPEHAGHGSGTILPVPWHFGQVCWMLKKPCCMRTWPWPPQVEQVTGDVPGFAPEPWQVSHLSQDGTRIVVSKPWAACSSVISRL